MASARAPAWDKVLSVCGNRPAGSQTDRRGNTDTSPSCSYLPVSPSLRSVRFSAAIAHHLAWPETASRLFFSLLLLPLPPLLALHPSLSPSSLFFTHPLPSFLPPSLPFVHPFSFSLSHSRTRVSFLRTFPTQAPRVDPWRRALRSSSASARSSAASWTRAPRRSCLCATTVCVPGAAAHWSVGLGLARSRGRASDVAVPRSLARARARPPPCDRALHFRNVDDMGPVARFGGSLAVPRMRAGGVRGRSVSTSRIRPLSRPFAPLSCAQTVVVSDAEHQASCAVHRAFPTGTSQAELFAGVAGDLAGHVAEGFNCTVFSYGMTSSGKTFTLFGPEWDYSLFDASSDAPRNAGIVPRAIRCVAWRGAVGGIRCRTTRTPSRAGPHRLAQVLVCGAGSSGRSDGAICGRGPRGPLHGVHVDAADLQRAAL